MNHGLEKCVAKANRILVRHRIILGVDDRGKLSCHKTHLCFIYFDAADCVVSLKKICIGLYPQLVSYRLISYLLIEKIAIGDRNGGECWSNG